MSTIAKEVVEALRAEFGLADNRDMAVAQAVRHWYLAQYPHLGVMTEQPNLEGIIAKVRTPALRPPCITLNPEWSQTEIDSLLSGPRHIMVVNRIETSTERNAARYLALRNLPDHLLGATGVPGIAVPEGPDHGNFVSSDDADRVIDAYIARTAS